MTARLFLALAIAFSAAACGANTAVNASSISTGGSTKAGLFGIVTVSPGTPTCKPGTSCGRPAAGVTLAFVHRSDGKLAARAKTDIRGRYRVTLATGRYDDRIAVPPGGKPHFLEKTVILDSRQVDTLLAIPL